MSDSWLSGAVSTETPMILSVMTPVHRKLSRCQSLIQILTPTVAEKSRRQSGESQPEKPSQMVGPVGSSASAAKGLSSVNAAVLTKFRVHGDDVPPSYGQFRVRLGVHVPDFIA